jgi:hypothetical protein
MTPIVWIRGPAQLLGAESERRRMGRVRVGLHDVPCKDAEDDAVAWPGTDPPQGTDRAPRRGVWQGARDFFAYGAGSLAVYAAAALIVLKAPLSFHLPSTIAASCREVELSRTRPASPDLNGTGNEATEAFKAERLGAERESRGLPDARAGSPSDLP